MKVSSTYPGKRVLVVEDYILNQEILVSILELMECDVEVANHGAEALEMLAEDNFDCVFMDIEMPIMDGFEATKKIRTQAMDLPVIAVSASVLEEDVDKCFEVGMNDFMAKPISITAMEKILEKHLASKDEPTQVQESETIRFNTSNLQNMKRLFDEYYPTFIHTAISSTDAQLTELKEAIKTKNIPSLLVNSHSIRGSMVELGAEGMADLATRLATSAKRGELKKATDLFGCLEKEYQPVKQILSQQLQ